MKRHFYISDNFNDLKAVENDLKQAGIATHQIHVLSENDAGVEAHDLREVESVLKKDVVYSTEIGFVIGLIACTVILLISYYSGIADTTTWVPPIFLSIVILGFCTWEGGLIGIQNPHHDFRRFQAVLNENKHVIFIDIDENQAGILSRIMHYYPQLQSAGEGNATPSWVIGFQQKFSRFTQWAP